MIRKILIVTPRFPFDYKGACEQDRAYGVVLLKKLGYEVEVISMCYKSHLDMIKDAEHIHEVKIYPVLYRPLFEHKILYYLKRILIPLYWDGASYHYRDPEIKKTLGERLEKFRPDLVWFDYTYLWPLYNTVSDKSIPIITRSVNYEPAHFYGKGSHGILRWIRYQIKKIGERKALLSSNLLFAITPKEKLLYEDISITTPVVTLPLRRLCSLIGKNIDTKRNQKEGHIHIYFSGSNFTVHHMRIALNFVVNEINPLLQKTYPDIFRIHVIGNKLPGEFLQKPIDGISFHGYVKDLDDFIAGMDIALSPSVSGEGMQQKVFEPIVRGIPTVTSERALVGYPFYNNIHVLTARNNAESYVEAIGKLRNNEKRDQISKKAVQLSTQLFSEDLIMEIIDKNIKSICI